MTLSPGRHAARTPGASVALTPSTTHGGQPRSRGAPGGDDNGLLRALEPVDLLFEFGDALLARARGHGVFAIRSISAINFSISASG
jgi:hypothetical protein